MSAKPLHPHALLWTEGLCRQVDLSMQLLQEEETSFTSFVVWVTLWHHRQISSSESCQCDCLLSGGWFQNKCKQKNMGNKMFICGAEGTWRYDSHPLAFVHVCMCHYVCMLETASKDWSCASGEKRKSLSEFLFGDKQEILDCAQEAVWNASLASCV